MLICIVIAIISIPPGCHFVGFSYFARDIRSKKVCRRDVLKLSIEPVFIPDSVRVQLPICVVTKKFGKSPRVASVVGAKPFQSVISETVNDRDPNAAVLTVTVRAFCDVRAPNGKDPL